MFDGNHRTSKRPVNLSGTRNPRSSSLSTAAAAASSSSAALSLGTAHPPTNVVASTTKSTTTTTTTMPAGPMNRLGTAMTTTTTNANGSMTRFGVPRPEGKKQILAKSQQQRDWRREEQMRWRKCIRIQSWWRGISDRQRIHAMLWQEWWKDYHRQEKTTDGMHFTENESSSPSSSSPDHPCRWFQRRLRQRVLLQMILRLQPVIIKRSRPSGPDWLVLLHDYARGIKAAAAESFDASSPPEPRFLRFVWQAVVACLHELPSSSSSSFPVTATTFLTAIPTASAAAVAAAMEEPIDPTMLWETAELILEDCFGTRDRRQGPTEQKRLWYALGLATGYQHAIQIISDAFTDDKDEYNGIVAATNTAHTDRFRFLLRTYLVPALWYATPVEYPAGRACGLVLHWLFDMPGATTSREDIQALQQFQTSTPKNTTSLSAATVSYATNSSSRAGSLRSMSSSIEDPVERAMNQSIQYLLRNQSTQLVDKLLQRDAPLSIVWPFVYQNEPLRLYAGIVARGENLDHVLQRARDPPKQSSGEGQGGIHGDASNEYNNDDDDDDDIDDDSKDGEPDSKSTRRGRTMGRGVRDSSGNSKEELQTLPKLDRLQNTLYMTARNQCISTVPGNNLTNDRKLQSIAKQLANPDKWVVWSRMVVISPDPDEPRAYLQLLASLLATVTGLRARQSSQSPLLTKLAFLRLDSTQRDGFSVLAEWLWYMVQQRSAVGNPDDEYFHTASVFADVFAHYLIALRDDQFLERYASNEGSPLQAVQVIEHIKLLLYELYWRTPVRAVDFQNAPSFQNMGKARFLLTGTKVWNILYERWCRLVRHADRFGTSESIWWFPATSEHPVRVGDSMDVDDQDNNMATDDDDNDSDHHPSSKLDKETDELAGAFRDAKMARILTCIPQAFPFDRRVRMFQSLLIHDKNRTQDEETASRAALSRMLRGEEFDLSSVREKVNIRRDKLYTDSKQTMNSLGTRLRRRVQVTFVNQLGVPEAGIDGGGVFKEFMDDLIKDAFVSTDTTPHRLFQVTPLQTLAVNTALPKTSELLDHYQFLGRVLGKAVYESILVEPQFCLPFLNQLLGKQNSLEDLKNYDEEYYKNLTKLLSLPADEVEDLGLTFEMTIGDGQTTRTVELVLNGKNVRVTKQNVIQYVHLIAYQRLNVESADQTKAFLRGFRDLVPAPWVRLFSAYELQKLISGDDTGIDVASFKQAMQYASGYHPSQPIVQWFWEIVEYDMTQEQQRKLLKFMTSCSRQPLLGFNSLEPAPCVQQIRLPADLRETEDLYALARQTPLPTSSTCMNLLKLPNYPSKELMKWKLLAAIEANAGFELT